MCDIVCVHVPFYTVQYMYGRVCGLELVERLQAISDLISLPIVCLKEVFSCLVFSSPSPGLSFHLHTTRNTVIVPLFFFSSSLLSLLFPLSPCHVLSSFSLLSLCLPPILSVFPPTCLCFFRYSFLL